MSNTLKPAWQVQVSILTGEDTEAINQLEQWNCGMPEYYVPIIAIEVIRSIVPEAGKEPLIKAFIHAGKQNVDDALTGSVAAALKHLDGGANVIAELKNGIKDVGERAALEAVAKKMNLDDQIIAALKAELKPDDREVLMTVWHAPLSSDTFVHVIQPLAVRA